MKLLFTKNNLPISLLIRWGLSEPCSHMAVSFDNKIVIHSNFLGFQINWFDRFMRGNTLVASVEIELDLEDEENVYLELLGQYDGRPYDWLAFFSFIWAAFKFKFFDVPMPKTASASDKHSFICTELAFALPFKYFTTLKAKDLAIMSPHQVFLALQEVHNDSKK